MNLRDMSEGELRSERQKLLNMEEANRKGEATPLTWTGVRDRKNEIDTEFRARGLEPRTGIHVRLKNPGESNGMVQMLAPGALNVKIGELPNDELRAMKAKLDAELNRRGEN